MQRCNFSSQILLLAKKKKKVTCTNKPAAGFKNLPFSDVYSAWQRTTQNPQNAGGMEKRLGQGWPTVCVCVCVFMVLFRLLTDHSLNTPAGLNLQQRQNNNHWSKNDPWLFVSEVWWEHRKKKTTNWSESKSESGKATKRLSEPKQTTSQMQLLRRYCGRRRLAHDLLI